MSRFASCSKFFFSVCYLFSQFSLGGTVTWKGHKFSAFGLKFAQPLLNPIFLATKYIFFSFHRFGARGQKVCFLTSLFSIKAATLDIIWSTSLILFLPPSTQRNCCLEAPPFSAVEFEVWFSWFSDVLKETKKPEN